MEDSLDLLELKILQDCQGLELFSTLQDGFKILVDFCLDPRFLSRIFSVEFLKDSLGLVKYL